MTVPGTGEPYSVEASAPAFEPSTVATGAVKSEGAVAVTVVLPAPIPISKFAIATIAASMALVSVAVLFFVRTYASTP